MEGEKRGLKYTEYPITARHDMRAVDIARGSYIPDRYADTKVTVAFQSEPRLCRNNN